MVVRPVGSYDNEENILKIRFKITTLMVFVPLLMSVGACQFTGEPIFKDSEQNFNFGGNTNDSEPLSVRVRDALRKSPETAILRIEISTVNEDTVKLVGFVDNDAVRHEAERIAGQVPGVRFVVNSLFTR